MSSLQQRLGIKSKIYPATKREALRLGARFYSTGKPCINGHMSKRDLHSKCCACVVANTLKWRSKNVDKHKEYMDRYREDNRERILENNRKRTAQYYQDNLEVCREGMRKRAAANKEAARAKTKAWKQANHAKVTVSNRNRRARKRAAEGFHTAEDIALIRKQQKDCCAYTGVPLNGKGHVDHIIPLNRNGTNWPHNLQLLSDEVNISKSDRDPIEHLEWLMTQARTDNLRLRLFKALLRVRKYVEAQAA
jgi:hypothetical protein